MSDHRLTISVLFDASDEKAWERADEFLSMLFGEPDVLEVRGKVEGESALANVYAEPGSRVRAALD